MCILIHWQWDLLHPYDSREMKSQLSGEQAQKVPAERGAGGPSCARRGQRFPGESLSEGSMLTIISILTTREMVVDTAVV